MEEMHKSTKLTVAGCMEGDGIFFRNNTESYYLGWQQSKIELAIISSINLRNSPNQWLQTCLDAEQSGL